jgi:hypothetical protein
LHLQPIVVSAPQELTLLILGLSTPALVKLTLLILGLSSLALMKLTLLILRLGIPALMKLTLLILRLGIPALAKLTLLTLSSGIPVLVKLTLLTWACCGHGFLDWVAIFRSVRSWLNEIFKGTDMQLKQADIEDWLNQLPGGAQVRGETGNGSIGVQVHEEGSVWSQLKLLPLSRVSRSDCVIPPR